MKKILNFKLLQRSRMAHALAAALPLAFGIAPVPAHAAFDYQTGEVIAPTASYASTLSNNGQVVAFSDGTLFNLTTMTATATGVYVYALSDDGSVVLTPAGNQAALWRAGTGLQLLGWLPGYAGSDVNQRGLSADGTVVAGTSSLFGFMAGPRQAFRWTQASGMVGLGHLGGGDESWTNALSADGSTVVGGANTLAGDTRAFRWTAATNMQDLGTLGGATAEAQAVSANGAVVAGTSVNGLGRSQLFRWTSADGMVSLGDLGGDVYSAMMGRDGNAITGYSATATGGTGYYWTQASGMVDMLASAPAGFDYVNPRAISANGMVVVGQSNEGATAHAFRYTLAGGFQTVEAWLAASGVAVGSWRPAVATAVNEDGSVIVGEAWKDGSIGEITGFIARGLGTGSPVCVVGCGVIDIDDYNRSLQGAAYLPVQLIGEADIVLHGAHGTPMRGRPATGKGSVWVSGDWGRQENVGRDGDIGAGEIGGAWGMAAGVTAKMAIGRTYSRQDLIFNGKADNNGTYIVPELIVDLSGTPLTFSASGYYNDGKVDADRGYENTGTPVISKGSADSRTAGLRLRVDWHGAVTHGDFQLNPYVSATYYRTKLDGYTETGGGFPVRWDERTERTTLARLGADATQALNGDWTLIGRLEGVHRIDSRSTNATGQVIGLYAYDFDGLNYERDWLRASIGVEGKLGTGFATVMLNTSTETNGPTHWGYASYRIDF